MSGIPKVHPEETNKSDLRDLKSLTILELIDEGIITNPQDIQKAKEEYARREETDEVEDEYDDNYEALKDLAENGYEIIDGAIAYPTKILKKFIHSKQQGPIPKEWRETLEERAERAKKEQTLTAPNKDKKPETLEEKAESIKTNTERIDEEDFKRDLKFNPVMVQKKIIAMKNLEGKLDADSKDVYIATSEPLIARILGNTSGKSSSLLETRDSVAHWATRYDDYYTATDIIYGIRRQDKRHEWSIFSIDVTTGNEETIREKIDKSENPEDVKNHYDIRENNQSKATQRSEQSTQPAWTRRINFCPNIGKTGRHVEKAAPHFVIGLSKESIGRMLENLVFDENGIPEQIQQDKMIDFMITSEFLEQTNTQLQNCFDENRKSMLTDFKKALEDKILLLLGKKGMPVSEFKSKYERLVIECKQQDESYAALIDHTREIGERYKKQNAVKVEDDIKNRAKQKFRDPEQLKKLREAIAKNMPSN